MTISTCPNQVRFPKQVVDLLDQQFWRWGYDVKHKTGNLLVKYGLERIPPPSSEENRSSGYYVETGPQSRILLRSFAVFSGHDLHGGMLLKRFDGHPYRTPAARLAKIPYSEDDFPPLVTFAPNDTAYRELTLQLFSWIAEYESWIEKRLGTAYLRECLKRRDKRAVVEADQSVAAWSDLAQDYR